MSDIVLSGGVFPRLLYDVKKLVDPQFNFLPNPVTENNSSCPVIKRGIFYSPNYLKVTVECAESVTKFVEDSWSDLPEDVRKKMGALVRNHIKTVNRCRNRSLELRTNISLFYASFRFGRDFPGRYKYSFAKMINTVLDASDSDKDCLETVVLENGKIASVGMDEVFRLIALDSNPLKGQRQRRPNLRHSQK